LEEGDVDLHRGRVGRGGFDEVTRERLDSGDVARQAVGQRVGMRVDADAQRRADELPPRPQPLERRDGHAVAASGGVWDVADALRARSGLTAAWAKSRSRSLRRGTPPNSSRSSVPRKSTSSPGSGRARSASSPKATASNVSIPR